MVRALGADHVIDYTQHDFADTGRRYELVVDIGGRNSVSRLRRVLTPTGTLVIVGGEDGGRLTGGVGRQLRAKLLSPFTKQRLTTFISTEHHTYIDRLARHLETGAVVPAVGKTYALEHVPEAIRQLENGSTRGKSAIVIAGDRAARAS
jgi:NADPH:quinone reductase-like Zn-dependent oxidoreductase